MHISSSSSKTDASDRGPLSLPLPSTEGGDTLSRDRMNCRVFGAIFGDELHPQLGHYRIEKKLGMGGMGVVYAAIDERLERKVAIKLMRDRSDTSARRRFFREAKALAAVPHPNIVQIHDICEYDDQIILVMEYIDGPDLSSWLCERQRSTTEILEVFIAAGRGLMAAHARGIVHRDFKPANVMLGKDGQIRVVDFGVARGALLDTSSSDAKNLTEPGALIGTPAYMAPEQLRGDEADRSTDQFNFCVSLWEALFGVRPFDARTRDAALERIDGGELADNDNENHVPNWLRAIVARGLAADPEDRWPSMEALILALRRPPSRFRGLMRKLGTAMLLLP